MSTFTAGDVNGDGFSDLVVTATGYAIGQAGEGAAFVHHGRARTLSAPPAWYAHWNQANARYATAISAAGDVDGDGYGDILIGAPNYDGAETNQGIAFLYSGGGDGVDPFPTWSASVDVVDARFGWSVAGAGDVNGDGFADVVVGAPFYTDDQLLEGRAELFLGSPTGLEALPAWSVDGNVAQAYLGQVVAGAGDVDGDGYSDVLVGSPNLSDGVGSVSVYRGSPGGLGSLPHWTFEAVFAGSNLGYTAASAGDVNGDGYSDIVIGEDTFGFNGEGRAHLFLGSPAGVQGPPSAFQVDGIGENVGLGAAVSTAGDVNGDGYSDFLVSEPFRPIPRVHVFYGNPTVPFYDSHLVFGTGGSFGSSVSAAGDTDADGYSDIVVGSPDYALTLGNEGRADLHRGSSGGIVGAPDWNYASTEAGARFGYEVAGVGDVNGDGFADVMIGCEQCDFDQSNEGVGYLFYGSGTQGRAAKPEQWTTAFTGPVSPLLVSDSGTAIRLRARGRTAAGRGDVRMEYEVEPSGVALAGSGGGSGPVVDTGAPGVDGSVVDLSVIAGGLAIDTPHHWRLRIASTSPFFPRSRWFTLAHNGPNEADFRTNNAPAGVETEPAPSASAMLGRARPSPFRAETVLEYRLSEDGDHRLEIHDLQGRVRARLASGHASAGPHQVRWDGRDDRGEPLPAGVYFVRLRAGGRTESARILLQR